MLARGVITAGLLLTASAAQAESTEARSAAVVVHGQAPWKANTPRRAVSGALESLGFRVDSKAEGLLFFTPPPPPSTKALGAADRHLKTAQAGLGSFAVAEARQSLTAARKAMKPWIGLPVARDLDQKRLELEVALAHLERDEDALQKSLRQYAVRYPQARPGNDVWPPDLLTKLDNRARMAVTTLAVQSNPSGDVWLDGLRVGPAPLEIPGVTVGRHRVQVQAPGHHPADQWVVLEPAKAGRVDIRLPSDLASTLQTTADFDAALQGRLQRASLDGAFSALVLVQPLDDGRLRLRFARVGLTAIELSDPRETKSDAQSLRETLDEMQGDLLAGSDTISKANRWPWAGAAAGVAMVGVGVGLRLWAVSAGNEFQQRQGALTQTEAFGLRDAASSRSTAGTAVISVGSAAALGFAGWAVYEMLRSEP